MLQSYKLWMWMKFTHTKYFTFVIQETGQLVWHGIEMWVSQHPFIGLDVNETLTIRNKTAVLNFNRFDPKDISSKRTKSEWHS
jgi:hypothetical protein